MSSSPHSGAMSASARSILVFGIYLLALGAGLLVAPAPLLAPFGVAAPLDVWARVSGMVVVFLGVYYVQAARHELRAFIACTVATRASVIVVFATLVATGLGPAVLMLFGAVDLAGALWTWAALKQDIAGPMRARPATP